ncbi:DUF4124 domain-containing protein [uncultured Aquabacterium sp.]|uniref:DUF4124 domain-containing protein n=1 Tax=Aquabacterium sp. TaxID=1872578 RepID=UPI0025EC7504|nr:DUF4124 domain-containing protein [uncultured Aquabacterium sp.]
MMESKMSQYASRSPVLVACDRRAGAAATLRPWWAALVAGLGMVSALAAGGPGGGIYSCVDASGKRHTSDRPIPECLDREQRVLNRDGSQRQVLPPRMNAEERAAEEERQRQRAQAEAARKDAIRRDRNLMLRYPNEAAHQRAREAALDDLRKAIASSERQVAQLQDERKGLQAETEFYKGKRLPPKLKSQLDANEAQQQAQRDIILNQQAEMGRINAFYDTELTRLRKLWAGAAPGSIEADPPGMAASAGR